MIALGTGSAQRLRLVSASAGSGKTYCLTQEVTGAVNPRMQSPIKIEGLVAVTFTTKAQLELETRIRRVLVENGAFEQAQELPLAYVGTVHAVCLRWLKEFAIDAGLSPDVDVIPGNEGRRLLQAALERGIGPGVQSRLEELATQFRFQWFPQLRRHDWITPVDDIMTLARSNRIAASELPGMGRRSAEGLLALLPPPAPSGRPLELELAASIATAIEKLTRLDDETKVTQEALGTLRSSASALERDRLPWADWAKLARLAPAKRALPLVEPVREAASAYEIHPRFRAELRELTELLFDAARVGLAAYARWKEERGLVDYVDMLDRALDLLEVAAVAAELRERLELVVVDEFQDTSPIQLALFMRLHALAGRSVWVGDRKQCIFEYAGADPALMEAVTDWAARSGAWRDVLPNNHRSRPELVQATSTLFAAAFATHGYSPEDVITNAKRQPEPDLEPLPPIGVWWLQGSEQDALAEGVVRLLQDPESTPVVDRATLLARKLRPSDVAVLVHSNAEAGRLSAALQTRGIVTVLPRVGLLTTPEGTLVTAALRLLVDRRDTLAAAEVAALTGAGGDVWLAERLRAERAKHAAPDPKIPESEEPSPPKAEATSALPPQAAALERLRDELGVLSPAEALDRVLAFLDLPMLAVRWPDPEQRLANLDALRALAAAYEERCSYQREAASLAGLLRYFEETQQELRQRDEDRATDEQHVGAAENAVVISTYHKAKGLEWPVVILGSLGRARQRDAFEVSPESDRHEFDAADPLGGRWIRYWPRPHHKKGDSPLAQRAADSPVGQAVGEREARERVRLLYVGCTRARDHLIFGVHLRKNGPSKAWLDELRDARGLLLTLPEPEAPDPLLLIRGPSESSLTVPVRAWSLKAAESPDAHAAAPSAPRPWFARATEIPPQAPAYRIAPSRAADEMIDLPPARVLGSHRFARRMPFANPRGSTWDQVGTALHAFLAADRPELGGAERSRLALRILEHFELGGSFTPEVVISASDALRAFITERWPDATWHREIPIAAAISSPHGRRRIDGTIDLLLETPQGFVVIDHKSFPGRAAEWEERALGYAPQLLTYAKAIEMAGGTVIGKFVHFTIGGGVVEIGEVAR